MFFLLPYEHSESHDDQLKSVQIAQLMIKDAKDHKASEEVQKLNAMLLTYAEKHKAIVDQFGRFPHRNDVLGRPSTAEESEYLKTAERFGQ